MVQGLFLTDKEKHITHLFKSKEFLPNVQPISMSKNETATNLYEIIFPSTSPDGIRSQSVVGDAMDNNYSNLRKEKPDSTKTHNDVHLYYFTVEPLRLIKYDLAPIELLDGVTSNVVYRTIGEFDKYNRVDSVKVYALNEGVDITNRPEEFQEIVETKIQPELDAVAGVRAELEKCINSAKYLQLRGFSNETARTSRA